MRAYLFYITVCVTTILPILGQIKIKVALDYDDYFDRLGTIKQHMAMITLMEKPELDVACSPVSVLLPLAKLALGAEGLTLTQLEAAVGLDKRSIRKVIPGFINMLEDVRGVRLNIVSKVYISERFKLKNTYKADIQGVFSEVERVDFASKYTANMINLWVKDKTRGQIKRIVSDSDFNERTAMLMVSAVHFSGKWAKSFNKPSKSTFYAPGSKIRMDMMTKVESLLYKESTILGATLLEIPYAGREASFIIILPYVRTGLFSVLKMIQISGVDILSQELKSMRRYNVEVKLPKFKISTDLNLNPLLKRLGMKGLFEGPGLSAMVENNYLKVDKAVQKVVIEVNRYGTKASAATAVQVDLLSSLVINKKFVAEHPFLFFIKVKREQLFAGIFNGNSGSEDFETSDYNSEISL